MQNKVMRYEHPARMSFTLKVSLYSTNPANLKQVNTAKKAFCRVRSKYSNLCHFRGRIVVPVRLPAQYAEKA